MGKYNLTEAGVKSYSITKEEYQKCVDLIVEDRVKYFKKEINLMTETIGVPKTKSIIRGILKDYDEE